MSHTHQPIPVGLLLLTVGGSLKDHNHGSHRFREQFSGHMARKLDIGELVKMSDSARNRVGDGNAVAKETRGSDGASAVN
jgi:hypothetical protein